MGTEDAPASTPDYDVASKFDTGPKLNGTLTIHIIGRTIDHRQTETHLVM
jgi:hypothetical protein